MRRHKKNRAAVTARREDGSGNANSTHHCDYTRNPRHGQVDGKTWVKRLHGERHMLRKPPAWAVDLDDLERAEQMDLKTLRIVDLDAGVQYVTPLARLRTHGFTFNRGWGEQIGLGLGAWQVEDGTLCRPEPKSDGLQLALEV